MVGKITSQHRALALLCVLLSVLPACNERSFSDWPENAWLSPDGSLWLFEGKESAELGTLWLNPSGENISRTEASGAYGKVRAEQAALLCFMLDTVHEEHILLRQDGSIWWRSDTELSENHDPICETAVNEAVSLEPIPDESFDPVEITGISTLGSGPFFTIGCVLHNYHFSGHIETVTAYLSVCLNGLWYRVPQGRTQSWYSEVFAPGDNIERYIPLRIELGREVLTPLPIGRYRVEFINDSFNHNLNWSSWDGLMGYAEFNLSLGPDGYTVR